MMEYYDKADPQIHSSFSNKSSFWVLKKINCPVSWTSPQFIYNTTRKMGMDFVAITDHNAINGAREITRRLGAFVSTEITIRKDMNYPKTKWEG